MDQPTSIAAVVVGLAAGIIATAESPVTRHADAADIIAPAASAPVVRHDTCARRAPGPNAAPAAVRPGMPPDVQLDSAGVNRAGGVGSLPSRVDGDPCRPVMRPPRSPAAQPESAPR